MKEEIYYTANEVFSIVGLKRNAFYRTCKEASTIGLSYKKNGLWLIHSSVIDKIEKILMPKKDVLSFNEK